MAVQELEKTQEEREKQQDKAHERKDEKLKDLQKPPKSERGPIKTLIAAGKEFMDDECTNLAAAIAYYALQSVIPLLIGLIAIFGLIVNDPKVREDVINGVSSAIPEQIGQTINLRELLTGLSAGAGAAGFISILLLLWNGSGIFDQFIFAINKAFDVEKDKRNFFVKLGLRLGMLLVLGVLLAAAFLVTIIAQLILNANVSLFGISPQNFSFLLPIISYVIPVLLQIAIFTILYRFSPARKGLRMKPILIGATFAAVLFELLKIAFTFYVTSFGAASSATKTYGAIGGIIVFLLFLYLVGLVILFGAELAAVMHNFKSGMATVETSTASVETPEKVVDGHNVAAELPPDAVLDQHDGSANSKDGKPQKVRQPELTKEQVTERRQAALTRTGGNAPDGEKNPVKLAIGSVIVVAVTALGAFLQRKKVTKN